MRSLARLVFPALRWQARGGFAHEQRRIERTLALGVGGYIVFGGSAQAARDLIAQLKAAQPHPLLFGADCERGAGQQFAGLTHLPPPAALGFLGREDLTARCGAITAREGRYVGLDWVFAPVADLDLEPHNPIVQTRSFGDDPEAVSAQVAAWVRAAEGEGIITSPKHYPGHGRTTADSHERLPVVGASLDVLLDSDLEPFASAIAAGARSIMVDQVAYPAWDPTGRPASLSPVILGYLRQRLGFDGVVVTDALIMQGVLAGRGLGSAAVAAVAAGADALLYPGDAEAVVEALERAASGVLAQKRLEESLARIETLARAGAGAPGPPAPDLADHAGLAGAVADLAMAVLRGEKLSLEVPIEITVVDDDVGGPYAVGPRHLFAERLRAGGVPIGPGGSRIVLVYAEPRSWKGRAGLGARSRAALRRLAAGSGLIVLFGHPRLEAQLPGSAPVLCAWHGQPLMQEAAARWVLARVR